MKPPVEHIKLSNQSKEQLLRIKRDTGIANWNILCRWAFFFSLSDATRPRSAEIRTDSNVEMSWKVFCGEYSKAIEIIFLMRCHHDDIRTESARASEFRKHITRGINMLFNLGKKNNIVSMSEISIRQ